MNSDFIIDVDEANFEYEVLAYSGQNPVVVDFWAPWCAPCRVLGPLLEKLAAEAEGDFRLAKLNADQNPKLVRRYHVHSIPTVKVFHEGQVVAEFSGLKSEPELREFFRTVIPNEFDLSLDKGASLLAETDFTAAEETYRGVLLEAPDHPTALLGLAKSLLFQNRSSEAAFLLTHFPPSKEFTAAETLLPLAQALTQREDFDPIPLAEDDLLEAAYHNALRLVTRGNIPAALDGLIDILRQNKRHQGGITHQVILALLELLGEEEPLVRQYRDELASILF